MILTTNSVCGLIDNNLADLIHTVITIIKFAIPILLIIFGMLDFGKGVMANKEDEIKSGQKKFIKRMVSAVLVFFVVTIVQLVIGLADDKNDSNESDVWNCANLILNGKVSNSSGNSSSSSEKQLIKELNNCCVKSNGVVTGDYSCSEYDESYIKCSNEVKNKYNK